MPRSIRSRASTENLTSLAAILVTPQEKSICIYSLATRRPKSRGMLSGSLPARLGLDQNSHDVALLHDQVFVVIDLDLGAGPFAEQHPVAGLEVDRNEFAALVASTWTNGDNFAL